MFFTTFDRKQRFAGLNNKIPVFCVQLPSVQRSGSDEKLHTAGVGGIQKYSSELPETGPEQFP